MGHARRAGEGAGAWQGVQHVVSASTSRCISCAGGRRSAERKDSPTQPSGGAWYLRQPVGVRNFVTPLASQSPRRLLGERALWGRTPCTGSSYARDRSLAAVFEGSLV